MPKKPSQSASSGAPRVRTVEDSVQAVLATTPAPVGAPASPASTVGAVDVPGGSVSSAVSSAPTSATGGAGVASPVTITTVAPATQQTGAVARSTAPVAVVPQPVLSAPAAVPTLPPGRDVSAVVPAQTTAPIVTAGGVPYPFRFDPLTGMPLTDADRSLAASLALPPPARQAPSTVVSAPSSSGARPRTTVQERFARDPVFSSIAQQLDQVAPDGLYDPARATPVPLRHAAASPQYTDVRLDAAARSPSVPQTGLDTPGLEDRLVSLMSRAVDQAVQQIASATSVDTQGTAPAGSPPVSLLPQPTVDPPHSYGAAPFVPGQDFGQSAVGYPHPDSALVSLQGPASVMPPRWHAPPRDAYPAAPASHSGSYHSGGFPNTSIWRLRYDGRTGNLDNYLAQLDAVAQVREWTDNEKGAVLIASLEGNASRVMSAIPRGCTSYALISQKLRDMFEPEANVAAYKVQFQGRLRKPCEAAQDYSLCLRELAVKAFPGLDHANLEQFILHQYIHGQPQWLRVLLPSGNHRTVESAVAATLQVEAYAAGAPSPQPVPSAPGSFTPPPAVHATQGHPVFPALPWSQPAPFAAPGMSSASAADVPESDQEGDDLAFVAEVMSELIGLDISGLTSCAALQSTPGAEPSCHYCGKPGHFWSKCRALINELRKRRGLPPRAPAHPGRSGGPRPYQNRSGSESHHQGNSRGTK